MVNRRAFCASLASVLPAALGKAATGRECLAYFGTYTRKNSKGIYVSRFQSVSGELGQAELAAETVNPSFVAFHPNRRFLYAVGETSTYQGQPTGSVAAFAIDRPTGKLNLLNQVASRGAAPCHLAVDKSGKCLAVANYLSGSVAAFPLNADGSLAPSSALIQNTGSGPNRQRQQGPHAHMILMSPDNRFVLQTDLGLDKVFVYRFHPGKGSLTPNDPPFAQLAPGVGPRHLVFHPTGRFVYVINELIPSVTVLSYDASRGALRELQTLSTLPKDFTGTSAAAELEVDSGGRFLYGSNRGHNSIVVFSIDPDKGLLTLVEHTPSGGKTPRSFALDPTGAFLLAANQDSDNVAVFKVDQRSGRLAQTGRTLAVGSPVCVQFLPLG